MLGTASPSTVTEHDAVPVRPFTNQSSLRSTAEIGTAKFAFVEDRAALVSDHSSEEDPVRVFVAGGERPEARERVRAVDVSGRAAARANDCRDHGVGVVAVDVVLGLAGEVREKP